MVNMPLSQLIWDLQQASNLNWAHFVHKIVQFLNLNICYIIYVLFYIKYWLMWFEILLVFILLKYKKCPNISGIRVVTSIYIVIVLAKKYIKKIIIIINV